MVSLWEETSTFFMFTANTKVPAFLYQYKGEYTTISQLGVVSGVRLIKRQKTPLLCDKFFQQIVLSLIIKAGCRLLFVKSYILMRDRPKCELFSFFRYTIKELCRSMSPGYNEIQYGRFYEG